MSAVVVYGVWFRRKYGSDAGTSLDKLFESESDAYAYARRCNAGPRQTGDQWFVSEHALHQASTGSEDRP